MFSLDNREKLLLLELARRAMVAAVSGGESVGERPAELAAVECAGAFVTLRRNGKLRGCIGQIAAQRAADAVIYSARAAALEDPRFERVRTDELQTIEIEISILSPPQTVAPDQVEVGRHGLIVSRGPERGVLLPQVATEYRWDRWRFLEETCVKAGLKRDAWADPETEILAFTATVFSERELAEVTPQEIAISRKPNYSSST
jgi:AmmeMemoRadiSam system protein A